MDYPWVFSEKASQFVHACCQVIGFLVSKHACVFLSHATQQGGLASFGENHDRKPNHAIIEKKG